MLNYFTLAAMATLVFGVPVKGSFAMLTLCTLLYVTATTGIGLVISTFTTSQVAAVFVTATSRSCRASVLRIFAAGFHAGTGQADRLDRPTSYYMHSP